MSNELVKAEKSVVTFNDVLGNVVESKALQIKKTFEPMVKMLEEFEDRYKEVVSMEISEDTCKAAKRLRLDIGQVRIKAEKNRKEQKQEYLLAGKAIDGVNNILKFAVSERETKLKDIENYYENLEAKIIEDSRVERLAVLRKIDPEIEEPTGLGTWEDDTFKDFCEGKKKRLKDEAKETKRLIEEEAYSENKAWDKEKILKLHNKRVAKCSKIAYLIDDFESKKFGTMLNDEYELLVKTAVDKRALQIEEEAHRDNKVFDKEKVLTDKADLFVEKLLKDGYTKRRSGDYIKDDYTISYSSLKTFNKREFKDRVKDNNDLVQAKENQKNAGMLILEVAAEEDDKLFDKEQARIKKETEEAVAAMAPDKEKLSRFADDLLAFAEDYNITLNSGGAKEILSNAIEIIMRVSTVTKSDANTL